MQKNREQGICIKFVLNIKAVLKRTHISLLSKIHFYYDVIITLMLLLSKTLISRKQFLKKIVTCFLKETKEKKFDI